MSAAELNRGGGRSVGPGGLELAGACESGIIMRLLPLTVEVASRGAQVVVILAEDAIGEGIALVGASSYGLFSRHEVDMTERFPELGFLGKLEPGTVLS